MRTDMEKDEGILSSSVVYKMIESLIEMVLKCIKYPDALSLWTKNRENYQHKSIIRNIVSFLPLPKPSRVHFKYFPRPSPDSTNIVTSASECSSMSECGDYSERHDVNAPCPNESAIRQLQYELAELRKQIALLLEMERAADYDQSTLSSITLNESTVSPPPPPPLPPLSTIDSIVTSAPAKKKRRDIFHGRDGYLEISEALTEALNRRFSSLSQYSSDTSDTSSLPDIFSPDTATVSF